MFIANVLGRVALRQEAMSLGIPQDRSFDMALLTEGRPRSV